MLLNRRAALLFPQNDRPGWLPAMYSDGLRFDGVQQAWIQGRRFSSMAAMLASGLVTFTRNSTKLGQWIDGHLSTFLPNVPTITDVGLAYDPSRTNIALNSNNLTLLGLPGWNKYLCQVATSGILGPDGTPAAAITPDGPSWWFATRTSVPFGAQTITGSLFLKAGVAVSASVRLGSSGIRYVAGKAITITPEWKRFSITAPGLVSDTGAITLDVTAANTSAVYVAFAQVEAGAYATSPILTGSSVATRDADVLPIKVSPGIYNVTIILADLSSVVVPNVAVDAAGYTPDPQSQQIRRIYFEKSVTPPISLYTPVGEWEPGRTDLMTLVSNAVSTWNDIVAAASLAQSSSTLRPAFNGTGINNLPAVSFDGVDDNLRLASQPLGTGAINKEIVLVLEQQALTSDTSERVAFCAGGTATSDRVKISRVVDGGGVNRIKLGVGNGTTETTLTGTNVDASGRLVVHVVITPTSSQLYVNGVSEGSVNVVPAIGSTRLTIGSNNADTPAGPWKGIVAPIGILPSLSAGNRTALDQQLISRYV